MSELKLNANEQTLTAFDLLAKLLENSFTSSMRTEWHMDQARIKAMNRLTQARAVHIGAVEDDGSDPLARDAYLAAREEPGF